MMMTCRSACAWAEPSPQSNPGRRLQNATGQERAELWQLPECRLNVLNGNRQPPHNNFRRNMQHAIPGTSEIPVPA
jgi:hypothetical protein